MAIDTPAKLAILGAGPIGLEAALYARFLGYDVVILERGEVAQSVRRWGHLRMFTPFGQSCSPLGLAAIAAQDESYQPPAADELLTGHDWADRYLLPLSQTDLLADHLRLGSTVLAVGKEELLKGEMAGNPDRGDWGFRILVGDSAGGERVEIVDAVLDCTGVFDQPNWLGPGGTPALGELALRSAIEYRLPDLLGRDRATYAGRHTLVIGGGDSATTNVVALARLAREAPGTRVTWITRREGPARGGPLAVGLAGSPAERERLAAEANRLAAEAEGCVTYLLATSVESLTRDAAGQTWQVELSGRHAGQQAFDQLIANVGFRPDYSMLGELQFQPPGNGGPTSLVGSEPNFYVLGCKSHGRRSGYRFSDGLAQIRELFAILGDRPSLDLYSTAYRLPR
ncbi:MAG: NAD(P)-binding domain-containing protein [Pirellulaceae bacterium]|nr:NAD(P)-binding domain-containing protein [Pirellulaceae bacterium]